MRSRRLQQVAVEGDVVAVVTVHGVVRRPERLKPHGVAGAQLEHDVLALHFAPLRSAVVVDQHLFVSVAQVDRRLS